VFKLGAVYRIDAQAYDTRTGTVRVARKVEGRDLFELVNDLTEALGGALRPGAGKQGAVHVAATSSEEAFRHYTEAGKLYESLRVEHATKRLEEALQSDPQFELARLRLATGLYETGDIEAAKAQIEEVMKGVERLPAADRHLARALDAFLERGDLAAGQGHLEQLLATQPHHRAAYVVWARALERLGRDRIAATRKLREAIEQDPNNLPAIVALARQMAEFGAVPDAEQILRDAAARNPQAAEPLRRVIHDLARPAGAPPS
jgi:tetratricopeptide (TPR) repeat protein